jgi:hypothetical protein
MSRFIAMLGFITTLFICLFSTDAIAQKKQLRDSLVEDFRSGTLIIRLKSHENKLRAIESEIDRSSTSSGYRKRLSNERDLIIANRDRFNQDLVTTFSEKYTFSKVRFMYDKEAERLRNGEQNAVFVGTDLKPIENAKPLVGPFYFYGEAFTEITGNSRAGLLVMDKNLDQLPSWFPSFFRAKKNVKTFFSTFGGDGYNYLEADKLVAKLSKRLDGL